MTNWNDIVPGYARIKKMRYSWRNPIYLIYKFINASNGKTYTGCTLYPSVRVNQHLIDLRNGTHYNKQLQADFICGHKFSVFVVRRVRGMRRARILEMKNVDANTYNIIKPKAA